MTSDGVTGFVSPIEPALPPSGKSYGNPRLFRMQRKQAKARTRWYFPLSVETGGDWPLLLVPAADGLQVWSTLRSSNATEDGQHRDEWCQAQVIGQVMDASLQLSVTDPGYARSLGFDLSVGDVNGDGRDDLMVRRSNGWTNTYSLYLQQTNGLFALEPALTYADKVEPFSWLCWADLNRDGKVGSDQERLAERAFIHSRRSFRQSAGGALILPTRTDGFRPNRNRFFASTTGRPLCRWWTWTAMVFQTWFWATVISRTRRAYAR